MSYCYWVSRASSGQTEAREARNTFKLPKKLPGLAEHVKRKKKVFKIFYAIEICNCFKVCCKYHNKSKASLLGLSSLPGVGGGFGVSCLFLLQPPIEYLPVPASIPGTKDQSQLPGGVSGLGGQTDGQAIINVTSTAKVRCQALGPSMLGTSRPPLTLPETGR